MVFETSTGPTVEELQGVLARIEAAVLTVDTSLCLRFANPAAVALLRRGDGLCLSQGQLTTRRPSDAQSLVGAMSACSGHRAAGSVEADASAPGIEHAAPASCCIVPVWRGYDLCPYQVVVIRVAHVRGEGCAAALFVGNLDEAVTGSAAEVAMLRTTFGLTAAEARLALRLAAGSTLADAADAFGVTQNTVRAQLRAVFDKTGARRQSELVRLLNGWRTLKLRLD